ncbi:hypothetical protein [uncultured Imperialibacter sp.]|uniref:hypothetical protein n=1 Tax=uncultured Imperialibacter sp. TaxID=1672639 RepID=UPI0030DC18CB|tara:strand:+ start:18602 stop:19117 length:516 start_codon:yes stop_codon:yes gene_type:complete
MQTITHLILVILLVPVIGWAQAPETDALAKAEVTKLGFITGRWEGKGWMYGQDRVRREFDQVEDIKFKLDSTAILIEGKGSSGGKNVHNAMAIITFNKSDNNYSFYSYLSTGQKGEFKGELIGEEFYWYPAENMRYIISINGKGQWYEKGEINMGTSWFQFFEMTLDKVGD